LYLTQLTEEGAKFVIDKASKTLKEFNLRQKVRDAGLKYIEDNSLKEKNQIVLVSNEIRQY
jgi:hypothetical protein